MDISNVAMTQFTSSAAVVFLMQKLKNASWFPLVQEGKQKLNRLISIFSAALVTIGISWTWSLDQATGTHTFAIMGLSWMAALHGAWHWLNQYALQETVYQATSNKAGTGSAVPPAATPKV